MFLCVNMKTKKIIDNIVSLFIIGLISALSLIITNQANDLEASMSSSLSFVFTLNLLTSVLLPFILFVFFFLTIKISLSILENNIDSALLYRIICYSFIPLLLYVSFYAFNFIKYTKDITLESIEDFYKIKYLFGLTIYDFQKLSFVIWLLVFICLIFLLVNKGKIPVFKSVISVLIPSGIVLAIKIML